MKRVQITRDVAARCEAICRFNSCRIGVSANTFDSTLKTSSNDELHLHILTVKPKKGKLQGLLDLNRKH